MNAERCDSLKLLPWHRFDHGEVEWIDQLNHFLRHFIGGFLTEGRSVCIGDACAVGWVGMVNG